MKNIDIEGKYQPVLEILLPLKTSAALHVLDYLNTYAQTNRELDRLSWRASQGKEHLQKTYGKDARSQLTLEELKDFLDYLKAQQTHLA